MRSPALIPDAASSDASRDDWPASWPYVTCSTSPVASRFRIAVRSGSRAAHASVVATPMLKRSGICQRKPEIREA